MHGQDHPIPVIIDTDSNLDDLLAITYLVKSRAAFVKAITTTGTGVAHWEYAPRNVLDLLQLLRHPKVPVSFGARRSLSPMGSVPSAMREQAGEVMGVQLPHNSYSPSRIPSAALISDTLSRASKPMTLLALAPMTNLALALRHDPSLARKIKRIYFVGGALRVPGNIEGPFGGHDNAVADYNIALDVEAMKVVLESQIPMTLIPLDIAKKTPITKRFIKKVDAEKRTAAANFVYDVLKRSAVSHKGIVDSFGDVVGAVLITNPDIAEYRKMRLAVSSKEGPEYGRIYLSKSGYPIRVAVNIDASAFEEIFFNTVNGH